MAGVAYHCRAARYFPKRFRSISPPKAGQTGKASSDEVSGNDSCRRLEEIGALKDDAIARVKAEAQRLRLMFA
jgi:hypothetical protein